MGTSHWLDMERQGHDARPATSFKKCMGTMPAICVYIYIYVYMHGILQGTAPMVLYRFLEAMETHIQPCPFLERYFPFWHFPKAWKCSHVANHFFQEKSHTPQEQPKDFLPGFRNLGHVPSGEAFCLYNCPASWPLP